MKKYGKGGEMDSVAQKKKKMHVSKKSMNLLWKPVYKAYGSGGIHKHHKCRWKSANKAF